MKDALETRLGTRVLTVPRDGEPSSLISWITEYSAVLLNRYEVGHDGKTAYERLRGTKSKVLGVEFGEAVQWRKIVRGDRQNKLDIAWDDGVYVGHKTVSGESIIATKGGFRKTRTIRRRPEEDRWRKENWDFFVHFPCNYMARLTRRNLLWKNSPPRFLRLDPLQCPTFPTTRYDKKHPAECT